MAESTATTANPPATAPVAPDPKSEATAMVEAAAAQLGYTTRRTSAGIVHVVLPETTCFGSLASIHDACKAASKKTGVLVDDLLSSERGVVLVAVRIGRKRERPAEPPSDDEARDVVDKVETTIAALTKQSQNTAKAEIDVARGVLERALVGLTSSDEKSVQSYGVFLKKLASSDPRPRVVIALRLNAGVPIRTAALRHALGPCWSDGAFTTADAVSGVDSVQLPLSAEGSCSREFGNLPLLVVTSVPVV